MTKHNLDEAQCLGDLVECLFHPDDPDYWEDDVDFPEQSFEDFLEQNYDAKTESFHLEIDR